MTTQTYVVTGMTCGHCEHAVKEEIGKIATVTAVEIELHPGEASPVTVTSQAPISLDEIRAAVDEAGYELVTD